MKKLLTLLFTLQILPQIAAQPLACHQKTSHRSDPAAEFDDYVRRFVAAGKHLATDLKTIPTVVHIVYRNTADSLPLARVESQIEAMNRDFRRQNADTSKTRPQFRPVAADCQIEFCLARRNAQGQPTLGVVWHFEPNFSADSLAALMARTQWPPQRYLNIWVKPDGEGGASSFAWEAGSPTDGFWLGAKNFGTFGSNLKSGFDEGGIGSHEAGHFLGLYHTFEDGFVYLGQCDFPPCDSTGDRVCDTPLDWVLAWTAEQCENGQRFCNDGSTFFTQSENFMAYAYDTCSNMFSQGQRIRLRAALDSLRAPLCSAANLAATGCQPTSSTAQPDPQGFVRLSPNPVRELLFVETAGQPLARARVFDLTGNLKYEKRFPPEDQTVAEQTLALGQLPAGIYFLEIGWKNGARQAVRFLKN